jgi:signal transduction histidine kinase
LRVVLVRGLVGGVGAVGIAATGWALWVGRRHARDVRALDEAAHRLGDGDFDLHLTRPASGELRDLAVDLERLAGVLQGLRRTRAEFVASVAHDLRAPLQVVELAAERLARGVGEEQDRRALEMIVRECRTLGALADDLLVLGQSDAAALAVTCERVDLVALLDEVRGRVEADRPGVRIRIECEVEEAHGDHRRLSQVLTNLAVNAARHSPTGAAVLLAARRAGDGGVELIVEDEGPGIDPALLETVTRPFVGDREGGGAAGLGLSIARRIVAAHGGLLRLGPRPGGGTRAIASLPGAGV